MKFKAAEKSSRGRSWVGPRESKAIIGSVNRIQFHPMLNWNRAIYLNGFAFSPIAILLPDRAFAINATVKTSRVGVSFSWPKNIALMVR